VLDIDGIAWMFGRNQASALGASGPEYISENAPWRLRATELGAPKGTRFVHAACGRGHSILVGSNGQMWTAGVNNVGQVGRDAYYFYNHKNHVCVYSVRNQHVPRCPRSSW